MSICMIKTYFPTTYVSKLNRTKFRFSDQGTKIWKNLPLGLTLLSKCQNKWHSTCALKNQKKSWFLDSKSTVKMCEKKLETQRKKRKDKCDTTDCCWHICIKPSLILTKCYYHCILLLSYYFTVLVFHKKRILEWE